MNTLTSFYLPKSSLNNLEPSSETGSATNDTSLNIYLDVVVLDLAVTFRGVIVAHDHHWPDNLHALLLGLDEDERVSLVRRWVGRVGNGQDDVYGVTGVSRARDPLKVRVMTDARGVTHPFVTGKRDFVARDGGGGVLEVGSVRGSD
jgi:hypothetical protein